MGKAIVIYSRLGVCCILLAGLLLAGPAVSLAADTVCARVKIEIKQELTLERQAFDAHMRINNGLANISLEDVKVEVFFTDENATPVLASADPANTDALFFIRLDSMENIDSVGDTGTVDPSTTADIHWLIIPSPGSSNGLESGTLYYVGAKLTYTIGGEQKVTEVTPDYIFVKPMPELTLDYFLPSDVYGDDPLTEGTVESIEPFSLGVRVKNSGHGVAKKLKIESAQPKITENEQGLLIGFSIEGSEVNGLPATESLLVDFGDISANSSGVARWIMTCTLSGKFVSFTAGFSHSDELGGELTSLIKSPINTHFLVRDVIVDLPGRDTVRDFLAIDGSVYRIYESEVTGLADLQDQDPEVADQSPTAVLTGTGDTRTLTTALAAGYMYVRLTDPFGGQKAIKEVIRSDGKIIKPANAWLSHTRVKSNPWKYYLNLFDVNSPGTYTLKFKNAADAPQPPAMEHIEDKTVAEGEPFSFIVEANDPNGTVPQLSAAPLPTGAKFNDQGQGLGVFDWTPGTGQAGVYGIVFTASDGALEISRRATITVQGFHDTDGDGLDDDWEMQHFGTLHRDGRGDFDRDGISDLDEFLNETNPAALADLAVHQAADNLYPSVGDELVLTVTATNKGLRDATGVQLRELLSAGLRYIRDDSGGSYDPATGVWDITALQPNATAALNITAQVTRSGKILNIAALSDADLYDPKQSNNSAALILNGGIQSDLALAQTIDNPMPEAGETIAVHLMVSNNGIDDATGVQISDVLPVGLNYENSTASQGGYDPAAGTWDVGDLTAGTGATLDLTLKANNIDEIILTAAISGSDQPDPDPTNNRTTVVFNQNLDDYPFVADLAVSKLANQSAVDVGEQVAFTLLVRNNGPDDAGSIEINDLLPDGLVYQSAIPSQGSWEQARAKWQVGTIAAGSFVMMDMIVEVSAAGAQTNTAVILSPDEPDEFDPDGDNNSATESVTGMAADIGLTQTFDKSTANVGQNVDFTVTVTNHGPHDSTGVVVVDETPPGLTYLSDLPSQGEFDSTTGRWNVGDLAIGSWATFKITFRVENPEVMVQKFSLDSSSPTDTDIDNNVVQLVVTGNAPPVVGNLPDLTIEEGTGLATIKLDDHVTDSNNADAEIGWSFSSTASLAVRIDDNRTAFVEVSDPNWSGSETITFTATDPFGMSDEGEILFTVTAVNDAPLNTVPDDQITSEDTALTIAPSISIADIDAESNPLQITLTATRGTLTLAKTNGLTFAAGDGIADTSLTFSGIIMAINTALDGLRFDPDADYFGNALIEILTNDQGRTGAGGPQIDTDALAVFIAAVNDPPRAVPLGSFGGDEGQAVLFSGSAADIDSTELTYQWDFDYQGSFETDAGGVNLTAPQGTYYDNGSYTVALRVVDQDGGVSEIVTGSVTIEDLSPVAAFTKPDDSVSEGSVVAFSDTSTSLADDIVTRHWDFGDGTTGSDRHPAHVFQDNGTYTVRLTVTDDDDSTSFVEDTILVANTAPAVAAGPDQTVNEGDTVTFSGAFSDSSTADTHTFVWNFGDGSPLFDASLIPAHRYADNGVYTVTLMVTDDDGGVGTDALSVTVDNVVPSVVAGDDLTATEGDAVQFSATYSDPGDENHTIHWDFGDGGTAAGTLIPVHSYGDNGTYTVTVTVIDMDSAAGTGTLNVVVANAAPVITGLTTDNPSNGDIRLTATFADPGWLDSHSSRWEFGDGVITDVFTSAENEKSTAPGLLAAVHTYSAEGLFTAGVTVTDDDGGGSTPRVIDVLIDKTAPVISVFEPQAGYYPNTDEIKVDVAVEDPESSGVSSGLAADSVVVTLDGRPIAIDELLALSELADGFHSLYAAASDNAGNRVEHEVVFEVGPESARAHIEPHKWDLKWLDPFENLDGHKSKEAVKALISLENAEVETIIPTDKAARLTAGDRYGDFAVVDVIAAQTDAKPGHDKIVSLTLKYVGIAETDILAFSGDVVRDFYSINTDDTILIDGDPAGHLGRHTVLSSYQSDPPLLSAADIIPETVLLNGQVPIIEGSARLITEDVSELAQSGVIAEPPYGVAKEKKHHVWLAKPGQPRQITLQVGSQTIFADEPYPVNWQDWFSLTDDGQLQMMRIHASEKDNLLRVLHHNLQAEARIYLDGALALTILPETKPVVMEVLFNRFDAIATLFREDLERGGDWLVATDNGATLKGKHPRKHISVSDIGSPQIVKLVIGDTAIFDDQPFPIKWSERHLNVDGERQDMSIKTHSASGKDPYLSIDCKKLTREARLYLDDKLVLLISPPPEVDVVITGELELDDNPATYDGTFRGSDAIELKGKLPKDCDPAKIYQVLNISGEPALQIGDRIGDFEMVSFTEEYQDYRVTDLEFICEGLGGTEIKVYEDFNRNDLVDSYLVDPGDYFPLDVSHLAGDKVYFEIGENRVAIDLTGKNTAAAGDVFLDCTVFDTVRLPLGPPHYVDLTLEYVAAKDPIVLTAHDGKQKDVIGTYRVDSDIDPVFTIDGSRLPKGHLGENLVLEYGWVEPSE